MKEKNRDYKEPEFEEVLEETDEDEFVIGQVYEDKPDKKLVCKKCGTDKFIIGAGTYHTSIKCPNCKYEKTIHDG